MNKQFENLPDGKKVFLVSDFHLGAPNKHDSREREKKIIRWIDSIKAEAAGIFMVGDLFDFWFEYKHVIPKGAIRLQAKLIELIDDGIPIIFFTGNHDMWMFDYFTDEFGIPVYREPETFLIDGQKVLIGHGDGLGPGDHFYKFLKVFFESKICRWAFSWLHPNIGMGIANYWSGKSRIANQAKDDEYKGEEEWLYQYCLDMEKENPHDLYVFGHRHLPIDVAVGDNSRYINLGEWVTQFHFGELSRLGQLLIKYEE